MASGSPGGSGRRRGRCKWFNVAKGWGFITPDDGSQDVFVHQSVIQMSGFRSLADEEEVEFECKTSGKGLEATTVTGIGGVDCRGSHRRPQSKKRFRKIRCYNCGEFANHIAAKCTLGPQPKRCHNCKAVDHLIADCPSRDEKKKKVKNGNSGSSNDTTNHTGTNGGASGGSQPPSQPPSESHPSPSPCPSPSPGDGNAGNGGTGGTRHDTPKDTDEGLAVNTSSNNGNLSSPSLQELHVQPMEPASRGYVITSTAQTNNNNHSSVSCQPAGATIITSTAIGNPVGVKCSSTNGEITNV